jgi:peptidyl-prolyl cis-trans isomerase C
MDAPTIEVSSVALSPLRRRFLAAMTRVAGARFVQFLVIGGAIFVLAPGPVDDRRIELSSRELMVVQRAEAARQGASALSPQLAAAVRARLIEDELLFREGVRLGLDRGDPMIRQRVVQKVLLLAEDLGGATRPPSAAEIREAYQRAPERYRQPARIHLMHVFASQAEALPAAASLDLGALPRAGEPFPLPRDTWASAEELQKTYGPAFAAAVQALPPGRRYSAPIESVFGWHRVRVVEVEPGRLRTLAEVERELAFELAQRRRRETVSSFLTALAATYQITIDGEPLRGYAPTPRLARREAASGED